MEPTERATLHRCFAKTKELFMTNKHSESWSHNLIDGTKELTTPLQWKHMYVWLANPRNYDEGKVDSMEIDTSPPQIDPYPEQMQVNTFQNGLDTIIHVKNSNWRGEDSDEKQMEDEKTLE